MNGEKREGLFEGEECIVTITLEDDSTIDCVVLTIFEAGDREYIAVVPNDEESDEVYLYRYTELEDGQPQLENIETDEEYDIVSDAFDEILDEQEFEDLLEDEEAEV
ncbi:MAG: DUF1292 domain-containing protein [Johnsonella sp.]|nr:DUF1292 domain-containing protein [Johnsonella sp.]